MQSNQPDPSFQVASPLFDRIVIKLNKDYYTGDEFVIETADNLPENLYIKSLELNGKPVGTVQLPFADVVRGGKLKVTLSAEPNESLAR